MPGTTRFDEALFDSDAFGFDVDSTVYANPNAIEQHISRSAGAKLIRQDDSVLQRQAPAKLTRRQE